jgi:hypothetical protein
MCWYYINSSDHCHYYITLHYNLLSLQAYRVLGHIDLLGDPLSLAQSYGKGMSGFVRGMAHGHVKKAAKELVQGVVGGNLTR